MSQAQPQAGPGSCVWPMYRAMVGVGLGCGLLIVAVYQLTRPIIERNEAEALQRAAETRGAGFIVDCSKGGKV